MAPTWLRQWLPQALPCMKEILHCVLVKERDYACKNQVMNGMLSSRPYCSCAVMSLFRSDLPLPETHTSFHTQALSLTCVAHICQAQDTKAVVATSSQKHSAFQLCVSWLDAWRDHACASSKPKRERERANLPLFRHKGKPCFPMMDPSLRCCLSL